MLFRKRIDYYLLSSKGLCHLEGIGIAARDNNNSQEGLKNKKNPASKRCGVFKSSQGFMLIGFLTSQLKESKDSIEELFRERYYQKN